jgi:hypothetical protein
MAKEEPPICSACGVAVTIIYILTECRIYNNIRTVHNIPESLAEILNNHPKSIANIIQFIKTAKIQTKI